MCDFIGTRITHKIMPPNDGFQRGDARFRRAFIEFSINANLFIFKSSKSETIRVYSLHPCKVCAVCTYSWMIVNREEYDQKDMTSADVRYVQDVQNVQNNLSYIIVRTSTILYLYEIRLKKFVVLRSRLHLRATVQTYPELKN